MYTNSCSLYCDVLHRLRVPYITVCVHLLHFSTEQKLRIITETCLCCLPDGYRDGDIDGDGDGDGGTRSCSVHGLEVVQSQSFRRAVPEQEGTSVFRYRLL
jgi:hypothetical protein